MIKKSIDTKAYTENIHSSTNDLVKKQLSDSSDYVKYREVYNNAILGVEYDFPVHIDIENIYACNLNCIHCARQYIQYNNSKRMEQSLYKKIINEATSIGTRSLGFAIWGEVFLDKGIFKKIKYAKERGVIDIRLHSNGLLIDEEIADKIVKSGVTWMSISLDAATEKTYEKIRGGNLKKSISAIGNIINAKMYNNSLLPQIRASFVKTNINENESEIFSEVFGQYCDVAIQEFYDPNNILPDLHPNNKVFERKSRCFDNFFKVVIKCNGDVAPCCEDINANIKLGNIRNDTLYNIYNSPLSKDFRKQHKEGIIRNKYCKICLGLK